MPFANTIAADSFDLGSGITTRVCRTCSAALPLNAANFYHRFDRTGELTWVDARCMTCCRRRDAETRAARRARRRSGTTRKFGVEMECIVDYRALRAEMTRRGLNVDCPGYTHRVIAGQWKIVRDASVPSGWELVSPPLSGPAGIEELKQACESLAAVGARVNRSCGLHVHHDVGDLRGSEFTRLLRAWSNNQRNIDGLVAPSRRGGQWAMPLTSADVDVATDRIPADATTRGIRDHLGYTNRYRSLNVQAFPRYGTVEVRQHQGTTNFAKIAAWIAFGQAFIEWAKTDAPVDSELTTDALVDRLATSGGLAPDNATALKSRAAHFARRPVAA